MARIRTIKPEFPQSESVGRLSRDARLLFIQIWTICDDSGRTRAASRMLASLLYPYDDDAKDLIEAWLSELEEEGCIRLYEVDGAKYLQIPKWLEHQKIDRPSASKFPAPRESSTNPREASMHPSVGRDQGRDQGREPPGGKPPAGNDAWHESVEFLRAHGNSERSAWGCIGQWRKKHGDERTHAGLRAARENEAAEPVAFINGWFKSQTRQAENDPWAGVDI